MKHRQPITLAAFLALLLLSAVLPVVAGPWQASGFKAGEVTDTTAIVGPDRDNKFDNHSNPNWKFESDRAPYGLFESKRISVRRAASSALSSLIAARDSSSRFMSSSSVCSTNIDAM